MLLIALATVFIAADTCAQQSNSPYSSRNIEFVSHHPLGGSKAVRGATTGGFSALGRRTGNLTIEQESGRPYVYVARRFEPSGFTALDLSVPEDPHILYDWKLASSYAGIGVTDITTFEVGGDYFVIVGVQMDETDPDPDLAAIIFDVSNVGKGTAREVTRIRRRGGYHHLFAYRHSDGRSLLFATGGDTIDSFDLSSLLGGASESLAVLSIPEEIPNIDYGFYNMKVFYHVDSGVDRLYTSGAGGYYVYDIADPANPMIIATVSSAAIQIGREIGVTPDGSLLVTTAGYRASPLRIFDLTPAFSEGSPPVRTATGAWVADWRNRAESVAVRWPFIFVAAMEDGFQVVNMRNPLEPYTDGYYQTWTGKASDVASPETDRTGAWDIDVRNSDGLVVVSDVNTGLWAFRVEGFQGWDGRGWGYPNISDVQNWTEGPVNSIEWPVDGGLSK